MGRGTREPNRESKSANPLFGARRPTSGAYTVKRRQAAEDKIAEDLSQVNVVVAEDLLDIVDGEKPLDALRRLRQAADTNSPVIIPDEVRDVVVEYFAHQLTESALPHARHQWMSYRNSIGLDPLISEHMVIYWDSNQGSRKKDLLHLTKTPLSKRALNEGTKFVCKKRGPLSGHRTDELNQVGMGSGGRSWRSLMAAAAPRGMWQEADANLCPDCARQAKRYPETQELPEDVFLNEKELEDVTERATKAIATELLTDLQNPTPSALNTMLRGSQANWDEDYEGSISGEKLADRVTSITQQGLRYIMAADTHKEIQSRGDDFLSNKLFSKGELKELQTRYPAAPLVTALTVDSLTFAALPHLQQDDDHSFTSIVRNHILELIPPVASPPTPQGIARQAARDAALKKLKP